MILGPLSCVQDGEASLLAHLERPLCGRTAQACSTAKFGHAAGDGKRPISPVPGVCFSAGGPSQDERQVFEGALVRAVTLKPYNSGPAQRAKRKTQKRTSF